HKYSFTASDVPNEGPMDFAIDLKDANGNIVNSQGVVDGGLLGSTFTFVAAKTGTYYLDVSAPNINPTATSSYTITAADLTSQSSDTVLDTSATNASLVINGTASGAIDATPMSGSFNTALDHDWFAVSMTAGHVYSFSAFATSGSLDDLAIDLVDAN